MDLDVIIGIGIFVVVLGGIGTYFLIAFLKGKVEFTLDSSSYDFNDEIDGKGKITAKKIIEANSVYVRLYCQETEYYRDRDGKRQSETRTIYEDKKTIEGSFTLNPGEEKEVEFSIRTPHDNDRGYNGTGVVGQVLSFMSNNREKENWYVELVVDAKGIDLSSKKEIYVD